MSWPGGKSHRQSRQQGNHPCVLGASARKLGFELVDLAHQIKANKKRTGLGGPWAIHEHAAGRSPLRCSDPRRVCETERESMTQKLLLDAEGVRRTVDSQMRAINKCRGEFRYQCDSRPHIDSTSETNGKGIVPGKAGNLGGY